MWIFDKTLWEIALRTTLIYLVVFLGLRLTGKREVGTMTPLDLVLLLLIANAVQNAMTGPDTSLTGGWVAAGTLLFVNFLVTRLLWRHKKLRHWVEGQPTPLIHQGQLIHHNLTKEKVTEEELLQALREHGVGRIDDVATAMLEIDGTISVLCRDELPTAARPHHHIRFHRKQ